jgi:hypothetical protein
VAENKREIFLSNSGHENFETLIGQRLAAVWLSGEFPYILRKSVTGIRKNIPVTLPDGDVLLYFQKGKNVNLLQLAADKTWMLSSAVRYDYDQANFVIASRDLELSRCLLNRLTKGLSKKKIVDPYRIPVKFWYHTTDGPQATFRTIDIRPWNEIDNNYAEHVRGPISRLMKVTGDSVKGRIILMHGPPGSGKTTLLRALGGSWRSWCTMSYILDPDIMLNNGTYMMQALLDDGDRPSMWSLVIMEDAGELFSEKANTKDVGQALSRLLNVADGILGQGRRVIFALTTNEPIQSVNAAVMRPGRAMANLAIPAFSREEATQWLGRPVPEDTECTLANLLSIKYPESLEVITSVENKPQNHGQYL